MVSQNPTEVSSTASNRGFVEGIPVTDDARYAAYIRPHLPLWRPAIAGALFVLSLFTLSWYLMLGCHVGINSATGAIDLGLGAAWWLCITSAIAFFIGPMISSMISPPRDAGILRGLAIWALTFPLGLVIFSFTGLAGGLVAGLALPHAGVNSMVVDYGFYWSAFVLMAVGLVFSVIGGLAGCACRGNSAVK